MTLLPEVELIDGNPARVTCAVHTGGPHPAYFLCRHLLAGDNVAYHVEPYPEQPGVLLCPTCVAWRGSQDSRALELAEQFSTLACAHCVAHLVSEARRQAGYEISGGEHGAALPAELHPLAFAECTGYEAFAAQHGVYGNPFEGPDLRWAWSLGFRRRRAEAEGIWRESFVQESFSDKVREESAA